MDILELFGVDWKLMLAQLINFVIVVAVLWWFALKPLIKKMKERNKEITKGLEDAKEAEERLDKVEQDVKDKLKESRFDAEVVLNEARQQAEGVKTEEAAKTKKEIEQMIDKAKQQIESEKKLMVGEVKQEVSQMIVKALEKILSEKLTKEMDREYVEKVLKKLE